MGRHIIMMKKLLVQPKICVLLDQCHHKYWKTWMYNAWLNKSATVNSSDIKNEDQYGTGLWFWYSHILILQTLDFSTVDFSFLFVWHWGCKAHHCPSFSKLTLFLSLLLKNEWNFLFSYFAKCWDFLMSWNRSSSSSDVWWLSISHFLYPYQVLPSSKQSTVYCFSPLKLVLSHLHQFLSYSKQKDYGFSLPVESSLLFKNHAPPHTHTL